MPERKLLKGKVFVPAEGERIVGPKTIEVTEAQAEAFKSHFAVDVVEDEDTDEDEGEGAGADAGGKPAAPATTSTSTAPKPAAPAGQK